MPELLDHGVNVRKGAVCRLFFPLFHLNVAHLDLDLFTRLLRQLLHVAFDEFDLGIEVSIARMSIFELFFELQVSDLELVHLPLVLFLTFFESQVGLSELVELLRKLRKLLVELVHGHFMGALVVFHLRLQLLGPVRALGMAFRQLSILVL